MINLTFTPRRTALPGVAPLHFEDASLSAASGWRLKGATHFSFSNSIFAVFPMRIMNLVAFGTKYCIRNLILDLRCCWLSSRFFFCLLISSHFCLMRIKRPSWRRSAASVVACDIGSALVPIFSVCVIILLRHGNLVASSRLFRETPSH